jgi:hypothetical protein
VHQPVSRQARASLVVHQPLHAGQRSPREQVTLFPPVQSIRASQPSIPGIHRSSRLAAKAAYVVLPASDHDVRAVTTLRYVLFWPLLLVRKIDACDFYPKVSYILRVIQPPASRIDRTASCDEALAAIVFYTSPFPLCPDKEIAE